MTTPYIENIKKINKIDIATEKTLNEDILFKIYKYQFTANEMIRIQQDAARQNIQVDELLRKFFDVRNTIGSKKKKKNKKSKSKSKSKGKKVKRK